jgi:hypothetical protein
MDSQSKALSPEERSALLETLETRFEKNKIRHPSLEWAKVLARLEANPEKLWSLNEMEKSGGEPDVVGMDDATGAIIFYDCAAETPAGRRNTCYDRAAREGRKAYPPATSVEELAEAMGIEILDEPQYRGLQELGKFDCKTQSWIKTPAAIRKLGGALFCDRRYDAVFVYHNGADSYYSGRGFRGALKV